MNIRNLCLLVLCLSFLGSSVIAQEIQVFKTYEAFEKDILNRQDDTVYVVNFWATWCKPCVEELPYFEQLHQNYKNQQVQVVLVSLDFEEKMSSHLKPFITKNNLDSKIVLLADVRANRWIDKISPNWSGAIPATLIYKGNERFFYERSFENTEEIEKLLIPLINN